MRHSYINKFTEEASVRRGLNSQEIYHEIFGSILDRGAMSPYLLSRVKNYKTAIMQATKMMGNRGFDIQNDGRLGEGEKHRAQKYIEQAYAYCYDFMFPFIKRQLSALEKLNSKNRHLYTGSMEAIKDIETILDSQGFRAIIAEDPRHLFLLASSRKYPDVFHGYKGQEIAVSPGWQRMACSILKISHLIKSIEEESQDVNDFAQLGLFFERKGQSLHDLYNYDWGKPKELPENEPAKRAFAKTSLFFHKLKEFIPFNEKKRCHIFNSGDGVEVDIIDIRARLKSPASMFTKLGKSLEGEAYNIRDILAVTFILKQKDDTLKLFHALQKRGVILQENVISPSITQSLFDGPKDMAEAVNRLMKSLSRNAGRAAEYDNKDVLSNAKSFYNSLGVNTTMNPHSSLGHRKFQCKINFFVPIHRITGTDEIIIPGTDKYRMRNRVKKTTEQHTLALELRISDEQSWKNSEYRGDSHHEAYKFRQLVSVMNRVFKNIFNLPEKVFPQIRSDQKILFQ